MFLISINDLFLFIKKKRLSDIADHDILDINIMHAFNQAQVQ